jgi:hypothetical protein
LPFFGRRLAALLDGEGWQARYLETRGWRPRPALAALRATRAAGLLYQIGGQIQRFSRPHLLRMAVRRPLVMHWAGSDVLFARRVRAAGRATPALVHGVTHWVGAPWLAEELAPLGVTARWLPHSWVEPPDRLPPLPSPGESPFTLLAYLPEQRAAFYGAAAVFAVARALPEARLLVVGASSLPDGVPPNVRCLGWVEDMTPLYARTHALLRLPRHDGLSFMVQEALALGRHTIWTYPFPGALRVAGAEEAIAAAAALARRHASGCLSFNETGAAHVRERYARDRIRADLRAPLAEAAGW